MSIEDRRQVQWMIDLTAITNNVRLITLAVAELKVDVDEIKTIIKGKNK